MGGGLGDILKMAIMPHKILDQQKDAQRVAEAAQNAALEESRRQDMEARRIAASAKPMEEQATLLTGGAKGSVLGNLGLMVEPTTKKVSTLGGTTSTGLGFGV